MHHLLQVVWVDCVQDVKEVISGWALALRILVWKIGHELGIFDELRVKGLNGELIIVRN